MKAIIKDAKWIKEYEAKFGGKLHLHKIKYEVDGQVKDALYNSKSKDQKNFIPGKESEFTEETRLNSKGKEFIVIKPMGTGYISPSGKALQREQTKYSGFAVSYVKDLIIADKVPIDEWKILAGEMAEFMHELDKRLTK